MSAPAGDEKDEWAVVGPNHPLSAPPSELATPLADPAPLLLNTHDLPWETVEHLVVALARRVDGAHEARLYGRRGQAQHGIDVVAFIPDRSPSIYQSKRWTTFTADDLDAAVKKYADGKRPFGAERIVVVATADGSDTAIVDRLHELRLAYPELQIDFWDQQQLSRLLRQHPDIVAEFFGPATADAFCRDAASSAVPTLDRGISGDAILRGPIAHLGMAQHLADADAIRESEPGTAAAAYRQIADALENSAYAPHASRMRERQAEALRAAGNIDGAVEAQLDVMASALAAGDPHQALRGVHGLANEQPSISDALVRAVNVLAALAQYEHFHGVTLEDVAARLDEVHEDDRHVLQAAAHFSEHAIAARREDLVCERVDLLTRIVDTAPKTDQGRLFDARIRACLADAFDSWTDLARAARTEYPPRVAALLLARHGRHLAGRQQPEAAIERYHDAIERACQTATYADAADWLFAIRLIRMRFGVGLMTGDINDIYRLALALRAQGNDSVLPAPFSARERVLTNLGDRKFPDAFEALQRYRWRSVVIASWADEREVEDRLARLYVETGNPYRAIQHLVAAGAAKDELEALAAQLPEETLSLPLPNDFAARPTWERVAAFTIAGAAADLLSDDEAHEWAAAALTEIVLAHPAPLFTPNPYQAAFTAFGQLAVSSTADEAAQFLDLAALFVEREAGHYRFTDDAHAAALARIARTHPDLRRRAVDQMCEVLIAADSMADKILANGTDSLRAEPDVVAAKCSEPAAEGNARAALALILAECDPTPTLELARRHLEAATAAPERVPGMYQYTAGWRDAVLFATALEQPERERLAEALGRIAEDRADVAHNRAAAFEALAAVARELEDASRDRLVAVALAGARGELDEGTEIDFLPSGPLDRFRFNMGPSTLRPSALLAAAALAHTSEQIVQTVSIAQELMPHADAHTSNVIARALALLPTDEAYLDVPSLASHSSEWIRALAAVAWVGSSGEPPEVGRRLVVDPSVHVRKTLAQHLPRSSEYDEYREVLHQDVRRSVRNALEPRE